MPEPTGQGGGTTPTPAQQPPAAVTAQDTVLSALLGGWHAFADLLAGDVAKVLGLWTAARAAVQTVASGIARAATQQTINQANAKYPHVPLSPPDLADMIVRNVLTDSTKAAGIAGAGYPPPRIGTIGGRSASDEAALSGIDEDRFAALVADNGESYGIIDALRMWNRGTYMYGLVPGPAYHTGVPLYQAGPNLAKTYGITEAELDGVIAYSRVRPEYTGQLKKLAKNTLSPADAVEMAVKQIVPVELAQSLFEAAGGVGEQFAALVDAAGDSAGVEKVVDLLAHGVIKPGQARQAIGMSRLNPRFYYLSEPDKDGNIPLNYKWLPIYELRQAMMTGLLDHDTALEWMRQDGYSEEQANLFLKASAAGSLSNPKAESLSVILAEYSAKVITESQATSALTDLGFIAESIPFLLQYATTKVVLAARNSAITRVRAGYMLYLIDDAQATADLTDLGLPGLAIADYLAAWHVERSVPHTALTTAEIGKLLKDGNIDVSTAETLWKTRGYTPTDVQYLLILYPPPAPPPPAVPAGAGGQ